MKFTLQRDRTVASASGHAIEFKKGVPTHVPPEMYSDVIAVGAIPEEELPDDDVKKASSEPSDPHERNEMIHMAMETIVKRNKREEFTATGAPHVKALAAELGWVVGNKERDIQWAAFQTKD